MPISPFSAAINQICEEKGLDKDIVVETVEAALAAAYRKEYGHPNQVIRAKLDEKTGGVNVKQILEVVKEVEEEDVEISLKEAKKRNKKAKVGDEIEIELPEKTEFGRIAAQTAKQVIIQRIREAERKVLFDEFKDKEGSLINGTVQQIEGNNIIINIGKTNGVMPPQEQIPNERYYIGQRLKVYVSQVEETTRGPRILVSRADSKLIEELFKLEVPEIAAGRVMIRVIAREAGSRNKIAVESKEEGLDPVGSCVGQRGNRVQSVLAEIGEEKIDIILWNKDENKFIENALSPAKIKLVKINKKNKKATVEVEKEQLSLAIGKNGQNVRLASKLSGYGIDIVEAKVAETKKEGETEKTNGEKVVEKKKAPSKKKDENVETKDKKEVKVKKTKKLKK